MTHATESAQQAGEEPPPGEIQDRGLEDQDSLNATMASGFRTLRTSIISLLLFFGLIVVLLLAVPGLRSAADRISDAKPQWVLISVALEILSCVGYVVLFEFVFAKIGRRLASRLSLSELAVNSVVSVSGMGGIALGAWVLRSKGVSVQRIARRSVLIFMLTSAVNVGAVIPCGVLMGVGWISGSTNPLLTFLPAGAALTTIVGTLALASWAGAAARRSPKTDSRWVVALIALSDGVKDTVLAIRDHDWRLLGSVGYWFLDNLCLFTCFLAYGHTSALGTVVMAYLVGMLANSIPIPGGFGLVDGGLVGMLLLYGERPGSVVLAAVITYRAISLWVPSIIGGVAFLSLRREIGKPLATGVEVAPEG